MDKIKILHCIYCLSGGGAERQLKILADISSKFGITSAIFCVNSTGSDLHDKSIKIYHSTRANKFNFSIFRSLIASIHDFDPDIVHAWLPDVVTIPTMIVAFIHQVPCVQSYRNKMFFGRPLSVINFILSILLSCRIVSNNPISQSSFLYRKLFSLKNGVEIANAVQINPVYYKMEIKRPPIRPYQILFVGRLTKQKNWITILNSLLHIDKKFNWNLNMYGEGEDRSLILDMISELHLSNKVKLHEYCKDIYAVMQEADVLILPSFWEGMPNVLLEALQIGLPCIVSNIYAHQNIIQHNACALTFDPFSPISLAFAINRFFNDDTLPQRLVDSGRLTISEFSAENMVSKYYNFYCDIMKHKSGRSQNS